MIERLIDQGESEGIRVKKKIPVYEETLGKYVRGAKYDRGASWGLYAGPL